VQSALFENNIFLVAQHMLQFAVTGKAAAPMPERISPWGMYDVFSVKNGEQIFLAVVGDGQWKTFCEAFGLCRPGGRPAHVPATTTGCWPATG
jgi:crotonobetainyl-CoA:carnitine CoA-transferase CaiB-like acyl-CoA transferase